VAVAVAVAVVEEVGEGGEEEMTWLL
jgi:hypothetical protein